MRKRKKAMKQFTLLLTALLLLTAMLVSCGSGIGTESDTTAPTTSASESTEAQTTEAATTTAVTTVAATTAAQTTTAATKAAQTEAPHAKTLVIVFSATGTTKGVAQKIAKLTEADLYEIIPAEPYSEADLNYNDRNSRTTIEMNDQKSRPKIGSEDISLKGYETIYIGYPIWWGDAPRIMSTFVESHDFTGMTVIPFCTSGSSGIGRSGENLEKQAGTGKWLKGARFAGSVSEDDLKKWIDGLK